MNDKTLIVIAIFVTVAILVLAFASPMVGNDHRSRRLLRARIDALTQRTQAGDQITLARFMPMVGAVSPAPLTVRSPPGQKASVPAPVMMMTPMALS